MSETVKGKNVWWYINSALVVLLTIGIGYLPPFGQITPLGMKVLGVFIGVLYGWCTVSMLWPSVWGIVALGCTGFCTVKESFGLAFGNDIVLLVVAVFMFAKYLEDSGLSQYMANWFISRKIGEGRPWVFTALILAAAYMLSSFVSIFCTIVIMWGIFYSICETVGIQKKSWYAAIVVFGIVLVSTSTGFLFTFKPMAALVINLASKGSGIAIEMDFLRWFAVQFVWSVSVIVLYVLVTKIIFRPDVSALKDAAQNFSHLRGQKMNKDQKVATVILIIFLLMLILPSILPQTVLGMAMLKNMDVLGVIGVCLVGLTILKIKDGESVVKMTDLLSKGVNWEMVLLLGATMPLGSALESADVGVVSTAVAWMTGIFGGLSPIVFLVSVVLLFGIVTQLAHNLILIVVFTPVLAKMALSFGVSPMVMAVLVAGAAASAFMTPAASANAAIVFGNTEWITRKQAYLLGAIIAVSYWLTLLVIGAPLGNLLFQ